MSSTLGIAEIIGAARLRHLAAVVAVLLAFGLGATSAQAGTPPAVPAAAQAAAASLAPGLALPGQPVSSLQAAFNRSPASLLKALACPIAQLVGGVLPQLTSVICAVHILGYAYRTTYVAPDGTKTVRYTAALAGIPTLIDVNGDGIPDFIGTLLPSLTPAGLSLTITRLAFPAGARVSIEAVALDPAASDTYVGLGEDGTTAGTAAMWNASVGVFGISSAGIDLGLTMTGFGQPATMGLLGEEFSGANADAPTNVARGDIFFSPVPSSVTSEIKLGQSSQEAIIATQAPTAAVGHVNLISPGDEKDIDATINQMPTSVDVVHQTQNGHDTTTYTANGTVGQLSVAYHDRSASAILRAVQVDASSVPAQLSFDQVGTRMALSTAAGSSIGSLEVRYSQNSDVSSPAPGTGPYLGYHRTSPTAFTADARLPHVQSATVDPSGPFYGDLVLSAPVGVVALSLVDDTTNLSATGTLSNMPQHTTVTIDLNGGTVVFDGHGTGIDGIAIHAVKTRATFFSRASRIDLTANGIPASETINFLQSTQSISATASAPISQFSLLASDGTDAPAVTGPYAWFEDTPTLFRAFVRLTGFSGFSFGPTATSLLSASLDAAQQYLPVHADISLPAFTGKFDGFIDSLPSHVAFALTQNSGGDLGMTVDSAQPINEIQLTGTNLSLPNFAATNASVDLKSLPSHLSLALPAAGDAFTFNATDSAGDAEKIGNISAQAWQGSPQTLAPDQLYYDDKSGEYDVGVDVNGLSALSFQGDPLTGSIDAAQAKLTVHAVTSLGTFDGFIDELPSHVDFSLVPDKNTGDSVVSVNTSDAINEINLTGANLSLPGGVPARNASIDIQNIPASRLSLTLPAAGDAVAFKAATAAGNPASIGNITAQLWQGSPHTLAPDQVYLDTNPGAFDVGVDVNGLSGLSFEQGASPSGYTGSVDASPNILSVTAKTPAINFTGTIDQLPAHVGFAINPGGDTLLQYDATDVNGNCAAINSLHANATPGPSASDLNLPGGAWQNLDATITDLPCHVTLTNSGAGQFKLDTAGGRIGSIQAEVWGGPTDLRKPPTFPLKPNTQLVEFDPPGANPGNTPGAIGVFLDNVGSISATTSMPLSVSYDIAPEPLLIDYNLTSNFDANSDKYLAVAVDPSNLPAGTTDAGTVNIDPAFQSTPGALHVRYDSGTGLGLASVKLTTNLSGGYLNGTLSNLPAHLDLCAASKQASGACLPSYVPPVQTFLDSSGHTYSHPRPQADVALQLTPLDGSGQSPSTPLSLNGEFCPSDPVADDCGFGNPLPAEVQFNDLSFRDVQLAFNTTDPSYPWLAVNTNSEQVTGDLQYNEAGSAQTNLELKADPNSGGFLAANVLLADIHVLTVGYDIALSGVPICNNASISFLLLGAHPSICP